MIRTALALGATALCLAPAVQAQSYNSYGYGHSPNASHIAHCKQIKNDKRVVGSLIGAVAGGVLGAAIADDGDDHHYHRRGYRGHRGYYGHRGHYRHRGYGYHHKDDDGDQIAGALIGGVLGAVVGGELASSGTDCKPVETYSYAGVPAPTRSPHGSAWATSPQEANRAYSVGYQQQGQELYGSAPAPTPAPVYSDPAPAPVTEPDCRTMQRETRLPDGEVLLEPVDVCRTPDGSWSVQEPYAY